MNTELRFSPIYWKNGMVFSATQLEQEYFAVLDRLKDVTALNINHYNYGLLGGDTEKNFTTSFVDNITNEKVKVSYCRAITLDGSRIEILNQNWDELSLPLSALTEGIDLSTSPFWYILLGTDPFVRIPEGQEDPNESPRRKPHTRPAYALELISLKELQLDTLANAIPIAKYENTPSGLRKVSEYIPPSARINSHEKLVRKYEQYDTYLNDIKSFSEQIITKIEHKKKTSKEQNFLADDINSLCKEYVLQFVHNYDAFKLLYKDLPPLRLITYFAKMARVLMHTMDTGNNKDHLLQYFREYATDLNVAQLNKVFTNVFDVHYVHYDIAESFKVIDTFLSTFHQILDSLVKLDYNILAKRNVVQRDQHYHRPEIPSTPGNNPGNININRRMTIRRPGNDGTLGDDLED